MRCQGVRLVLLQVVDDKNGTIGLVPILSEFSPGDLRAIIAEDRVMGGTLFSRGDLLAVLTLEIDDIDLEIKLVTKHKVTVLRTHVLFGVPCGRQLGVQRGIHDMGLGDIKIVLSSERFNGRALEIIAFRKLTPQS